MLQILMHKTSFSFLFSSFTNHSVQRNWLYCTAKFILWVLHWYGLCFRIFIYNSAQTQLSRVTMQTYSCHCSFVKLQTKENSQICTDFIRNIFSLSSYLSSSSSTHSCAHSFSSSLFSMHIRPLLHFDRWSKSIKIAEFNMLKTRDSNRVW